MPSIMDLFKTKELNFPGGATADGLVDSAANESKGGFKQGIKNFLEQELSGLRIKSKAEINSPLLYRTEAPDIAKRGTQDTILLKQQRNAPTPDTDNAIKLNPFSIIPITELPTRVVNLADPLGVHKGRINFGKNPSNEPITKDAFGKNGTELGKILKNSGGDPKQILGGAISAAKKGLRGAIFKDAKLEDQFPKKSDESRNFSNRISVRDGQSNTYSKFIFDRREDKAGGIKKHMGIGMPGKVKDVNAPSSYYIPEKEDEKLIIPFWITGVTDAPEKKVFFRTAITGLSETSTPSWEGSKFIGNPYEYFIYTGVNRSVTFNLNIYCTNTNELLQNWERLEYLTSKVYPTITDNVMNAPFIKFRLGDMYNNRTGFIESLSYTIPDNGTWEIDLAGLLVPKFIDVAITIKLIETPGSEEKLYDYEGTTAEMAIGGNTKPNPRGITPPPPIQFTPAPIKI